MSKIKVDLKINNTTTLKENAMLNVRPDLFNEWDFKKNDQIGLDIYKITKGSHKIPWWICSKCNSSYDLSVLSRVNGKQNCPYCAGKRINETNSLFFVKPDIAKEWHPTKNEKLTPHDVTSGSSKKVWWLCPKCDSSYDMSINDRKFGQGCPYCRGLRINHTNSLASLNPKIASEWNHLRNKTTTPDNVSLRSSKKVWWLGVCGHEWKALIENRTSNGAGCPYCSGNAVLVGFNDMWTTNPNLAEQLLNPKDGYKYTDGSNAKVDWKCNTCEIIIRDRDISTIKTQGLYCPNCSDKNSLGERIMHSFLSYLNISFKYEASFRWSQRRRYDFYLPDFNTIIEVHGEQHYIGGFERKGGNSLSQNIENDKLKEKIARKNGIDKYIVIDARKTSYKWIMSSIISSNLREILDFSEEDLGNFEFDINSSKIKDVWNLWKSGTRNISDIEEALGISKPSVYRYLRLGRELKVISS